MAVKRFAMVAVSEDGGEHGEQVAGGGDEGDELRLAGGDQPVAEGFQLGLCLAAHGADKQRGADIDSAAADEAFAILPAGLARPAARVREVILSAEEVAFCG